MNATEAREILAKIGYRDWECLLGHYTNGAFWLQWIWRKEGQEHRSQRWYVANTVAKHELVGIAWLAVEAEELKLARQRFLYRSQPIFDECDVDLLTDLHAHQHALEASLSKKEKKGD